MKIGIVVGSIREGRNGLQVGTWVKEQAQAQGRSAEYELIDLKDFDVPLFTSATHPMMAKKHYDDPRVQAWSDAIDPCDAYILVTPEYNHGVPAAFKNAVDQIAGEWMKKAVGFVGYGYAGGILAVENWRTILANFNIYDIRNNVGISLVTDVKDGALAPAEYHLAEVKDLFDTLIPAATAMATLR